MTAFTIGSIKERKTWAKVFGHKTPSIQYFTIIGKFKNREEFLQAFKDEIDEDVYDRRTIRWHHDVQVPEGKASVVSLDLDRE